MYAIIDSIFFIFIVILSVTTIKNFSTNFISYLLPIGLLIWSTYHLTKYVTEMFF